MATRRSSTELLLRWRHRLDSHQRGPGCNRVPESSVTVPGLRRRASNPRRRWLTATRSSAELLRKMCALDHVMPRGECMPAFLLCCPPQALRPQDGPGCASPADGDPCRTRTCVRCVRGSRPTAGRTGRELERKVEVSNPHGRAVYLFSKQGAPANEAYLPGRRGSGSNAGEVALGHRLASEHLSSRSTLQCKSARMRLRPTAPPARFERASSGVGDRCASSRATGAVGPESVQSHHPEPTRGPQPYQGCALPTEQ